MLELAGSSSSAVAGTIELAGSAVSATNATLSKDMCGVGSCGVSARVWGFDLT